MATILFAGHNLHFIEELMKRFSKDGHTVIRDQWGGHSIHDEETSHSLLSQADIIVCEWALGNSVWYSNNVRDDQSLFIRFHLQERDTDYPKDVDWDAVDNIIFISAFIQREAVEKFNIPDGKDILLPNYVETSRFVREKSKKSKRTLGLMGIVPRRKRFDIALDILQRLNEKGLDFQLRIKGKQPTDYPWMRNRPDELAWYEAQMRRMEEDPHLIGRVHFEGWSLVNDVPEWFSEIGFILSVSDFEGSHQAVAEGAASGTVPIIIEWPGASEVYPQDWCVDTLNDAVDMIIKEMGEVDKTEGQKWHRVIKTRYDIKRIHKRWNSLLGLEKSILSRFISLFTNLFSQTPITASIEVEEE